ncbi:unnamed protein product [Caenorhabditis angaria]|uniref:Serpentine Receptor, class I n=1 Tax=Caenorhabditis angaria TaxID=860376 RepID=A0A9P1N552_9PELO|nr:unnamed protein product [Caenorhabditis angaria]
MDLECTKESPAYYTICLHILAAISFPINCFGCYLVIFRTPHNSKYKYRQLYLQITSFIVENYMTWIAAGYYFFPMTGGFTTSSISDKFMRTHMCVVFYFFTFSYEMPALFCCFQYRADAAAELNTKYRIPTYITFPLFILAHSFPVTLGCLMYISEPSRDEQYKTLVTNFPKCLHMLDHPRFIVYDWRSNFWLIVAGTTAIIWMVSFTLYHGFLALYTMSILQSMRKHMSNATFKIHKAALLTITLQCIIPMGAIVVPVFFIFIVVLKELTQLQEIATDGMFLIAIHSLVSTIVMIFCNSKYSEIVRGFIGLALHQGSNATIEVISTTHVSNTVLTSRKISTRNRI